GVGVSILAAGMGADLIERHMVLPEHRDAVDGAFSSSPQELSVLVDSTKNLHQAVGRVHYGPAAGEEASLTYRRSIYFCRDLAKGHVVADQDVQVIRPALGLHPRYWDEVQGKVLAADVESGVPVSWDVFSD
ncbi:SAF domain-containing protein, partial [bacterium]|nr:SAF domain-containing protein [bacterium]